VSLTGNWSITYTTTDQWPLVRVHVNDHQRDLESEKTLARALKGALPVISKHEVGRLALSEQQLEGFKFSQQVIASFATEAARLSQDTAKHFEQFVASVKARTLELEAQFQQKNTELDHAFREKQQALEQEQQSKLKNLEHREQAHADAVKRFELRNNTAVRRDLLEKIKAKIEEQKQFKITDDTSRKRWVIHGICSATMLLSVGIVGAFVWKIFNAQTVDWHLVVPLAAWTSVFVSTGIFYLRWNDQWFREHAKAEFESQKFSADILRASWVAELLFEWETKKEPAIPPELVRSFTKNLFESSSPDTRLHPADQLADLLKQVSSLEISKGGMKMVRNDSGRSGP